MTQRKKLFKFQERVLKNKKNYLCFKHAKFQQIFIMCANVQQNQRTPTKKNQKKNKELPGRTLASLRSVYKGNPL